MPQPTKRVGLLSKETVVVKRADEEYCKTKFDVFIKQSFTPSQVVWEEVTQQNEPPDYYLHLDNAVFAVEVTTLIELTSVGSSVRLPHRVISRFFEQFVDEIGSTARADDYLLGKYLVSFSTPIDDFASARDGIRTKLLNYVRRTRDLEHAPLEVVFQKLVPSQRPQQCAVQKLGSQPNRVVTGGPVWSRWEGEAALDICHLVNERLNIKAEKLRDIMKPKILLLLDRYHFADRRMYEMCSPQLSSLASFHSVFVVQAEKEGFLLYSENRGWSKK
jgi:hypothetical protein